MDTSRNSYVLGFAVTVTAAVSALLAVAATALKPIQEAAQLYDRQKNIMLAAGLLAEADPRPRREIEAIYAARFTEHVVDLTTGQFVDDRYKPADLPGIKNPTERARYREVFEARDEQGKSSAWVLPVSGKGLWSILYGFLALDAKGATVKGITFYKHGETPGLGGEVDNPKWKANWIGKSIYDAKGLIYGVRVKKGKVDPAVAVEKQHYVDGISGATITGTGVTAFVKKDLDTFKPFLDRLKSSN